MHTSDYWRLFFDWLCNQDYSYWSNRIRIGEYGMLAGNLKKIKVECFCFRMAFFLEEVMTCTKRLLEVIAGWLPRHFIGAILVSLPALAVFSHVTYEFETNIHVSWRILYCIVLSNCLRCNRVGYLPFCLLPSFIPFLFYIYLSRDRIGSVH